jgi:U3 small nucleolar RNA-associated protein 10
MSYYFHSFFAHLVNVLGYRDFLAPVCMLLLEKSANRVVRQSPDEIQNSLVLPIMLFQQTNYEIQIHVGYFISLIASRN